MIRKYRRILLCALLPAAACTSAHAQVWTLPKNAYSVSAAWSFLRYDEAYDSLGNTVELPTQVFDGTALIFAAYGITSRLTAQVFLPYKFVSGRTSANDNALLPSYETGHLHAWGNIRVGATYRIIHDKPDLSASLFADANTVDFNYLNGLRSGYDSWAFIPGLAVAWPWTHAWLSFYIASEIETAQYSNAVLSQWEYGYKLFSFLFVAASMDLRQSVHNKPDCDCSLVNTALYLNNRQYLALTLKTGLAYHGLGLNFGVGGAIDASNVPAAIAYTIGLQYKKE